MEDDKQEALIAWLSKVTQSHIHSIKQLASGTVFWNILQSIPGIALQPLSLTTISQEIDKQQKTINLSCKSITSATSEEAEQWRDNYLRLKQIYSQMELYIKSIKKQQFFYSLSTLNLVEIAKGDSPENTLHLMNLVFIICINSKKYIQKIIELTQTQQEQLMQIIKQNSEMGYGHNDKSMSEEQSEQEIKTQKIKELTYNLEMMYSQNQSLREQLLIDREHYKRIQSNIISTKSENSLLRKQLEEKIYELTQKQNSMQSMHYGQNYEEQLKELQERIISQEEQYFSQAEKMKEQIIELKEDLNHYKNKSSEMEERVQLKNVYQDAADHTNCINIQIHREKMAEYVNKAKESSQNQFKVKLQSVKLGNLLSQVQSKCKRLEEELKNIQKKQFMVTGEEGNKLKMQFLMRVKSNLQERLTQYKNGVKNQNKNSEVRRGEENILEKYVE